MTDYSTIITRDDLVATPLEDEPTTTWNSSMKYELGIWPVAQAEWRMTSGSSIVYAPSEQIGSGRGGDVSQWQQEYLAAWRCCAPSRQYLWGTHANVTTDWAFAEDRYHVEAVERAGATIAPPPQASFYVPEPIIYNTSMTLNTTTYIQEITPMPSEQQWAENVERMQRDIARVFGISQQDLVLISTPQTLNFSYAASTTADPNRYATTHEYEAQEELTLLMRRFPEAIPTLKRAIERGWIDGGTYGNERIVTWDSLSACMSLACCIVGWTMRATMGDEDLEDDGATSTLENYVRRVNPGDTHHTSRKLASLYETLTRLEVEYQEKLLTVEEVLA